MKKYVWLLILIVILAGCSAQPNILNTPTFQPTNTDAPPQLLSNTPTQPEIQATPEQPIMSPFPTNLPSSNLTALTENAMQDLAQRLSIETSQIDLLEAKEVVWSNSSLGCPQPGMYYAEVLTPGYLIRLRANSIEFEYHASKGTELIYCENPQPPAAATPDDI